MNNFHHSKNMNQQYCSNKITFVLYQHTEFQSPDRMGPYSMVQIIYDRFSISEKERMKKIVETVD